MREDVKRPQMLGANQLAASTARQGGIKHLPTGMPQQAVSAVAVEDAKQPSVDSRVAALEVWHFAPLIS